MVQLVFTSSSEILWCEQLTFSSEFESFSWKYFSQFWKYFFFKLEVSFSQFDILDQCSTGTSDFDEIPRDKKSQTFFPRLFGDGGRLLVDAWRYCYFDEFSIFEIFHILMYKLINFLLLLPEPEGDSEASVAHEGFRWHQWSRQLGCGIALEVVNRGLLHYFVPVCIWPPVVLLFLHLLHLPLLLLQLEMPSPRCTLWKHLHRWEIQPAP